MHAAAQENMWKLWLEEVEGQIVIPCAETSGDCTFTQEDRIKILTACREERSIHRHVAQQQHLFTVGKLISNAECMTRSAFQKCCC